MRAWASALSSATSAAGQSDEDGLLVGMALDSAPPVGELGGLALGGVVGDGDAAALVLEEHVGLGLAIAQRGEGADLLGIDLAAVTGQLDGAEALADGAKGAAGLDLGELARVADADELAARGGDVLGQALVLAACRPCPPRPPTARCPARGPRRASRSASRRVVFSARMPASCSSVRVARLAVEVPSTGWPAAVKASTATPRAWVLPAPAPASTFSMP